MELHFKGVNPNKLHDELITAGINPWPVKTNGTKETPGTEITLYLPDDTPQSIIEQINAIVAAHDPTPLPQPPTPEERITALEEALITLIGI